MTRTARGALLLPIAFGLAALLVPGPADARSATIAVPATRVALKPFLLEVQITADHWEGDIHIPERWGPELRTAQRTSVHFRCKQRTDAPATISYQVFKGSLPATGQIARPVASGSLGKPPGKDKTREFDIDFTKFLPAQPDGKDYHVWITGPAAGGGSSVCSTTAKVSYRLQDVTQFPSPILKRVIGTKNALGQVLTQNQSPLAVISQIFRMEGPDLDADRASTKVEFLQQGKVVGEVVPEWDACVTLPSGEASLAVRTPAQYENGTYYVRVKSPWGTTAQQRIFVGGNRTPNVGAWRLLSGGTYENHAWTEECQGIATDGKYWYISSNNDGERAVYKFTIGMKQVARADLQKYGSAHVGALDCFNNNLYVALEQPKRLLILSTDFAHAKLYQLHGAKIGDPDPLGGTFAWCAVHPITGDVYTSAFSTLYPGVRSVVYYKKADDSNYVCGGAVGLGKAIQRVQGGDISPAGKLLLVRDSKPWGIYVYNIFNGKYYGAVTFNIEPGHPDYEELEGLAVSPAGTAVVKGSAVNVHLVLLDNDWPDEDDVYFKHVAVPALDDLFRF